jgi:molybdopterin-dependent oxidoreductase alpha subunit
MAIFPHQSHYQPISWQDAFQLIATHLNGLNDPNEAIFYTSGRTSNEAAFLYQLFVRQFGTNNLPDCSNMCHESSGVALSETVGIGKGSVMLEDFYVTDLILIAGQNPGTNHPRMLKALETAKRNGAKIIAINPLHEAGLMRFKDPQKVSGVVGSGTALADLYLQVKINGDVPLLKAFLKILYEKEKKNPNAIFDWDFIKNKTDGIDELLNDLDRYTLGELSEASGVAISEIQAAADLLATSKKIIACWAMGLTQHKNAVENIREIVNLLLIKGSIGKAGAGTCPVRGHSNVQGDRTMGIWEAPKTAFLDKLAQNFGFEPPRQHGYNAVNAIKAMADGKAKVFFAMGGNFLSATPDTEYTAKALQNCDLTVHVSTKLNRSHLIHGKIALILPCLGRTEKDVQASGEQFVSVENSMGIVHQSCGNLEPASAKLLSEPAIVANLAKATLKNSLINWDNLIENYDNIRNLIEKTIDGFENYNKRVRQLGGFYLPNNARMGDFQNIGGRAKITINTVPKNHLQPDEYLMMTIRSHDQFNTTIYGLDDRYRGIFNERRVVMMNPNDMKKAGFETQTVVNLYNYFEGQERIAEQFLVVPYNIPERSVATYFPEANVLVPLNSYADRSFTPTSKLVVIKIKKV